ncbi:MAG TPA: hypothetical protein VFI40_13120 [Nocardioides sp.]|nr:hypothetical protein [Nocardioides sp.]
MSEHEDLVRPGVLGRGGPIRTVLLVLLAYAVLGAVAGVAWEAIWTPPGQIISKHQVFYDSYASLRGAFTGTGLYVLVAAATSALLGLVVGILTRGRELLMLALVILGSVLAAAVMWRVGTLLGPADPATIAAHTQGRQVVHGELTVAGRTPYLVWPMTSLFVLAVVYFTWPGARARRHKGDALSTDHPEPGVLGGRHR